MGAYPLRAQKNNNRLLTQPILLDIRVLKVYIPQHNDGWYDTQMDLGSPPTSLQIGRERGQETG